MTAENERLHFIALGDGVNRRIINTDRIVNTFFDAADRLCVRLTTDGDARVEVALDGVDITELESALRRIGLTW